MNINIAAASNSTVDLDTRNPASHPAPEQEPDEPRMIGDFDGSAGEFWKLFRNEAKSYDDAQINTLKEGMDSTLIFVRSYSIRVRIMGFVMLMRGPTGWFIFCYSHSVRCR